MADTTKVQKALKECMEKYKDNPDERWKCNTILEQIPTDTTETDTTTTGSIGVRGPNYGKTKAKYKRQPPKEN